MTSPLIPSISIRSYSLKYFFRNNINHATKLVDKFLIENAVNNAITINTNKTVFCSFIQILNNNKIEIAPMTFLNNLYISVVYFTFSVIVCIFYLLTFLLYIFTYIIQKKL